MKRLVNILVVDDRDENLLALEAVLNDPGYRIVRARSGREALKEVLDQDFALILLDVQYAENGHDALKILGDNPDIDVVLMDVMMPEMDGYEATRRIRDNASFAQLPIIAITAKAMKGDREKCINAGASDYVTKPVDSDQLISLLRVWLSK